MVKSAAEKQVQTPDGNGLKPRLPIFKQRQIPAINTAQIVSALNRRATGGRPLSREDLQNLPAIRRQPRNTIADPFDETSKTLRRLQKRNSPPMLQTALPHDIFFQTLDGRLSFDEAQRMAQERRENVLAQAQQIKEGEYEKAVQGLQDLHLGDMRKRAWDDIADKRQLDRQHAHSLLDSAFQDLSISSSNQTTTRVVPPLKMGKS